ncbi:MAG: hypothetical protein Q9227_005520 [Pyrenula ochraceoflavens]
MYRVARKLSAFWPADSFKISRRGLTKTSKSFPYRPEKAVKASPPAKGTFVQRAIDEIADEISDAMSSSVGDAETDDDMSASTNKAGNLTISMGPSIETKPILPELRRERLSIVMGPSIEVKPEMPEPRHERLSFVMGPSVDTKPEVPEPRHERLSFVMGPGIETKPSEPEPPKERLSFVFGPSVETKPELPERRHEHLSFVTGPSIETKPAMPIPHSESLSIVLGPSIETKPCLPEPAPERLSIGLGPSAEIAPTTSIPAVGQNIAYNDDKNLDADLKTTSPIAIPTTPVTSPCLPDSDHEASPDTPAISLSEPVVVDGKDRLGGPQDCVSPLFQARSDISLEPFPPFLEHDTSTLSENEGLTVEDATNSEKNAAISTDNSVAADEKISVENDASFETEQIVASPSSLVDKNSYPEVDSNTAGPQVLDTEVELKIESPQIIAGPKVEAEEDASPGVEEVMAGPAPSVETVSSPEVEPTVPGLIFPSSKPPQSQEDTIDAFNVKSLQFSSSPLPQDFTFNSPRDSKSPDSTLPSSPETPSPKFVFGVNNMKSSPTIPFDFSVDQQKNSPSEAFPTASSPGNNPELSLSPCSENTKHRLSPKSKLTEEDWNYVKACEMSERLLLEISTLETKQILEYQRIPEANRKGYQKALRSTRDACDGKISKAAGKLYSKIVAWEVAKMRHAQSLERCESLAAGANPVLLNKKFLPAPLDAEVGREYCGNEASNDSNSGQSLPDEHASALAAIEAKMLAADQATKLAVDLMLNKSASKQSSTGKETVDANASAQSPSSKVVAGEPEQQHSENAGSSEELPNVTFSEQKDPAHSDIDQDLGKVCSSAIDQLAQINIAKSAVEEDDTAENVKEEVQETPEQPEIPTSNKVDAHEAEASPAECSAAETSAIFEKPEKPTLNEPEPEPGAQPQVTGPSTTEAAFTQSTPPPPVNEPHDTPSSTPPPATESPPRSTQSSSPPSPSAPAAAPAQSKTSRARAKAKAKQLAAAEENARIVQERREKKKAERKALGRAKLEQNQREEKEKDNAVSSDKAMKGKAQEEAAVSEGAEKMQDVMEVVQKFGAGKKNKGRGKKGGKGRN